MDKFAFIIHPLELRDLYRKFPWAEKIPTSFIEGSMKFLPPLKVSNIEGIRSEKNGNQIEGNFIACTLTSQQLVSLPLNFVYKKLIRAGKLAEKLGAKIVGLGAFTSVVGDAGVTIANNLKIAVTTGNSLTVATALEGTKLAAKRLDVDFAKAQIAIVGATGSIGKACAKFIAPEIKYLTLVARDENKLHGFADELLDEYGIAVNTTNNVSKAIQKADIVITVSSAVDSIIQPADIKPGAIICDVARPRDVSVKVAETRPDVLVIEGGVVEIPGDVSFNFNFGFPPKTAYACMAETMLLCLDGRFENYSLGRDMAVEKIIEINRLAKKHGFKLAGMRSFEKALTDEQIEKVRRLAKHKKTFGFRESVI